jgi:hypothetical protein
VNGFHFESTSAKAILISPFVHESLLQDSSVLTFGVSSSEIDSNVFVDLFPLNDTFASRIPVLSLLSIFRVLGNESPSVSLLASMHLHHDESRSSFNSRSAQSEPAIWTEC